MLSEVDKWSQKYTWFRKMTVCFLVILVISVIGFFLTLSSAFISTTCLVISFLSVLGIRIGLGKMDEFKSLYVNTVPMINPERDFKEERALAENEELVLSEEISSDEVEAAFEALVEEGEQLTKLEELVVLNDSSQTEGLVAPEVEDVQEAVEVAEVEDVQEVVEVAEVKDVQDAVELAEATEVEEAQEAVEATEVKASLEESDQQTLSLEEQVFETVKMILRTNHCEVKNLSFKIVGSYLTIYVKNRVMMRLKLTGRKQYVLTYLSQAEVEALGLVFDTPSKSEAYRSRVQFTSIAVLAQLEAQIVELYNRLVK